MGFGLGSTAWRTVRTSVFTLNLDFWLNILIFAGGILFSEWYSLYEMLDLFDGGRRGR